VLIVAVWIGRKQAKEGARAMQIKLEEVTLTEGAHAGLIVHDLVLTQCGQTIRLGLIADNAAQALRQLEAWMDANTMDLVEIMADRPEARAIIAGVQQLRAGGAA
jgi:hypothetical protein